MIRLCLLTGLVFSTALGASAQPNPPSREVAACGVSVGLRSGTPHIGSSSRIAQIAITHDGHGDQYSVNDGRWKRIYVESVSGKNIMKEEALVGDGVDVPFGTSVTALFVPDSTCNFRVIKDSTGVYIDQGLFFSDRLHPTTDKRTRTYIQAGEDQR